MAQSGSLFAYAAANAVRRNTLGDCRLCDRACCLSPSARLVYARSADASLCPDETALRSAVAARFGYDPFFAWAKRTVVVEVWRRGEQFSSRIQVLDDQGVARGVRELTTDGPSCSELFDATALAISIALDASSKADAMVPASEEPPPAAPPAAAPAPNPPVPATDATRDEPRPSRVAGTPTSSWFAGVDVLGQTRTSCDERREAVRGERPSRRKSGHSATVVGGGDGEIDRAAFIVSKFRQSVTDQS